MTRFVFLSFAFLALGFYELSGGNDFDPEAQRDAALERRVAQAAARNETIVASLSRPTPAPQIVPASEPATETAVTRTDLNLVSFQAAGAAEEVDTSVAPLETELPLDEEKVSIATLAVEALENDNPLSLAALETTPAETSNTTFAGTRQVAASTDTVDIRVVKGDLVNMRSGPGTEYDVIDQLTQATEVEVLSSNGQGWVELRAVNGGSTGWIAEFLLTGG